MVRTTHACGHSAASTAKTYRRVDEGVGVFVDGSQYVVLWLRGHGCDLRRVSAHYISAVGFAFNGLPFGPGRLTHILGSIRHSFSELPHNAERLSYALCSTFRV